MARLRHWQQRVGVVGVVKGVSGERGGGGL